MASTAAITGQTIAWDTGNFNFTPQLCTVTFNGSSGTPSEASRTINGGTAVGTLPTATRSGYTFGGWYTGVNGSGSRFTATTSVTASITVYAYWIEGSAIKLGKVSSEGDKIGMQDVLLIYQYFRGKTTFTNEQFFAADVNGDGIVNMQDVLLVYQFFRGKITTFTQ